MDEQLDIDAERLADEVTRYLAAVDAFRAANCEPSWRAEGPATALAHGPEKRGTRIERSTH
jgi:hypothetical protein